MTSEQTRVVRRFDEREIETIFERASRTSSQSRPHPGLTAEDLEAIAVQAGIESAHVRAAIEELELRARPTSTDARVFRGTFSERGLDELVVALKRLYSPFFATAQLQRHGDTVSIGPFLFTSKNGVTIAERPRGSRFLEWMMWGVALFLLANGAWFLHEIPGWHLSHPVLAGVSFSVTCGSGVPMALLLSWFAKRRRERFFAVVEKCLDSQCPSSGRVRTPRP